MAPASFAMASVGLTISISGLTFEYDASQSGSVFDSNSLQGRGDVQNVSSFATQVSQIDFSYNGKLAGSILSNELPYVDFLISGAYNIKKTGGTVTVENETPTFGFDLLTPTLGRFLSLDFSTVSLRYTNKTIAFNFKVSAENVDLLLQSLPFHLAINEEKDIAVAVSGTSRTAPEVDANYLLKLSANESGIGTVTAQGDLVPEPASFAALLAILVAGLEIGAWKKRRQQRSFN